jgi:ParB family chromosome partitioning protein
MGRKIAVQKKGLGKGLGALIPTAETEGKSSHFQVEVQRIVPNSLQPRRAFDEAKIEELAASIREQGVIQPLVVRRNGDGYELIAGERRLRAAVKAGVKQVPVVIREASDSEALQLALIENLQREDLNPIEEASAYQRLHTGFGLSQEEIAERVHKSRPTVANSMRLLLLPKEVQEALSQGKLLPGQARALLGLDREVLILAAARQVITKGLSTRETERLVRRLKSGRRRRERAALDPDHRALIDRLQRFLGTRVRLTERAGSSRGKLEIEYYSSADLERIIEIMVSHQG